MCKVRRNNEVKVLKQNVNDFTGTMVRLTRMTAKSGTIVYAVQAKRKGRSGMWHRYSIRKYTTLGKAWELYKKAAA